MIAFLFGVLAGGVTGYLTADGTGQPGVGAIVGLIVFFIGWLFGLFIFGDASDFDF